MVYERECLFKEACDSYGECEGCGNHESLVKKRITNRKKWREEAIKREQEAVRMIVKIAMDEKDGLSLGYWSKIKNVIFNGPATIVFWSDGTKTVVKCCPRDKFDPEKGLAMACAKKLLGENYYERYFEKWLPDGKEHKSDVEKENDKLKEFFKQYFG